MKRPIKRSAVVLSLAVGAALLLSACQISVEPLPPPTPDAERSVGRLQSGESPLETYGLPAGSSRLYRVNVNADGVASSFGLRFALDQNLDLVLQDSRGRPIVSSSSNRFFAAGSSGLGLSASDITEQAIRENEVCTGSCITVPANRATVYYVKVHNPTSARVNYSFYGYFSEYADEFEPRNDTTSNAPRLNLSSPGVEGGALETLNDTDYWLVTADGAVNFIEVSQSTVEAQAQIYSAGYFKPTIYESGALIPVLAGEYIVISSGNGRAATSGFSAYTLDWE